MMWIKKEEQVSKIRLKKIEHSYGNCGNGVGNAVGNSRGNAVSNSGNSSSGVGNGVNFAAENTTATRRNRNLLAPDDADKKGGTGE